VTKAAFFLDLLVVLVFAAAGRRSHDLDGSAVGVLQTAWPFVVGLVVGWMAVGRQPVERRIWWLDGVVITVTTLVMGILLRLTSGDGAALPFVLVATSVLTTGLVGWRAVHAAVLARRSRAVDR
jgi:hypothetical protein